MKLIDCTEDAHAGAILAIFNEAIANSTALYDYRPRAPESMGPWFATKRANGFPVIGAVDDAGTLLGFASYGSFRAWPAYKSSGVGRHQGDSLLLGFVRMKYCKFKAITPPA